MMDEACCDAYNDFGAIAMETFLYHYEYSMYNLDASHRWALDDLIYYQLFGCGDYYTLP